MLHVGCLTAGKIFTRRADFLSCNTTPTFFPLASMLLPSSNETASRSICLLCDLAGSQPAVTAAVGMRGVDTSGAARASAQIGAVIVDEEAADESEEDEEQAAARGASDDDRETSRSWAATSGGARAQLALAEIGADALRAATIALVTGADEDELQAAIDSQRPVANLPSASPPRRHKIYEATEHGARPRQPKTRRRLSMRVVVGVAGGGCARRRTSVSKVGRERELFVAPRFWVRRDVHDADWRHDRERRLRSSPAAIASETTKREGAKMSTAKSFEKSPRYARRSDDYQEQKNYEQRGGGGGNKSLCRGALTCCRRKSGGRLSMSADLKVCEERRPHARRASAASARATIRQIVPI